MPDSLTDLLKIWDLTQQGESVPLSFEQLCAYIDEQKPHDHASRYFDRWCAEGYIKANIYGEFLLTDEGLAIRKTLSPRKAPQLLSGGTPDTEKAWTRFRRLLSYYIDCISAEERNSNELYEQDYRKSYFAPNLPFNWLEELRDARSKRKLVTIRINTKHDDIARLHILSRQELDEPVYIAYPILMSISKKGQRRLLPFGMLPVDVVPNHAETEMTLNLRMDEYFINTDLKEAFISKQELRHQFFQLLHYRHAKQEDEYHGCIDLYHSLNIIQTFAPNPQNIELNPNDLDINFDKNRLSGTSPMLLNSAILMVGRELAYSQNLRKELRFLRDQVTAKQLDQTALAYVFRDPVLPQQQAEKPMFAYPFIMANEEQNQAMGEALNQATSRITGPPGTGKSQVAVNIIANHILRNQSVLFTSKNHRAVHAIDQRCRSILGEHDQSFVQFCKSEDGSVSNPWFKQDLDRMVSKAKINFKATDHPSLENIQRASIILTEAERNLALHQDEIDKFRIINQRFEQSEQVLRHALGLSDDSPIPAPEEQLQKIRPCISNLQEEARFGFHPRRLLSWLRWCCGGEKRSYQAIETIKQEWPDMLDYYPDRTILQEEIKKLGDNLEAYISNKTTYQEQIKIIQQLPNSSKWEERIQQQRQLLQEQLPLALSHQINGRILEEQANATNKEQLKDALECLKASQSSLIVAKAPPHISQAQEEFRVLSRYCPAWAVTMLSLKYASPCLPALFDLVIIDEASQCEIAPMIPALYRAKRVCVIGDPAQFPPVITLKCHSYLAHKHHLAPLHEQRFSYKNSNCYQIVRTSPCMLKQHYRCHPDIAAYFNGEFYANQLLLCADVEDRSAFIPNAIGIKDAVTWIDVQGGINKDTQAIKKLVDQLIDCQYEGSIGIITPLKAHADQLEEQVSPSLKQLKSKQYRISTVNSYQGGEMDMIIFVPSYSHDLPKGQKWFITEPAHQYIFNVAVSRARACLILVGDRKVCLESNNSALISLAEFSERKEQGLKFESAWEKRLYEALKREGIPTTPQKSVGGRKLDLALEHGSLKLDIEIDGVQYHCNEYGERKTRDLYRDIEIEAKGWQVQRFWVYELRQDMAACVATIKSYLEAQPPLPPAIEDTPPIPEARVKGELWQQFPSNQGFNPCQHWIANKQNALKHYLRRLYLTNYQGSIAILCPFEPIIEQIRTDLAEELNHFDPQHIDVCTIDDFPAKNRDLIILVLALSYQGRKGLTWYGSNSAKQLIQDKVMANTCLCLSIIGDREFCKQSNCLLLKTLARLPRTARSPKTPMQHDEQEFESPWELNLYQELKKKGINTISQYSIAGKRLDLAYIGRTINIDIEIDGDKHHLTTKGKSKNSDHYRDQQLASLGWLVIRFSAYDLKHNMQECLDQVLAGTSSN